MLETSIFGHQYWDQFRNRANTSNAAERKRGFLRSRFGGVLEKQISNLVGHFRYLALLLDAYDKRCLKIDRLLLSDNCSFQILAEYRENTTAAPS